MTAVLNKQSLIRISIGILLILMALNDVLQTKVLLITCAAISVIIFILCFPISNRDLVSESMLFITFLLITSIINLFFTQNNFGGSLTLLGNLLLSFLYIHFNNKTLSPFVVISYLITILFISYHLFVLNTHENFIYEGLSRNHAGFAVVFWTIFLLFHLKINHNYLPLLPAIIALILAFFLVGRTSLIVSALLLATVFFYKFKNRPLIRLISIAIFLGTFILLFSKFDIDLISKTNLDSGLDTPRWKLWAIYWEHIDFSNLLTGIDVTKLPMYDQYSGNPHNSFIKFHSRVGFGSIVFLILYFISTIKYINLKENYIFLLLMLLTLRAMFDGDMLIGNFDFIFFIITFHWIKKD